MAGPNFLKCLSDQADYKEGELSKPVLSEFHRIPLIWFFIRKLIECRFYRLLFYCIEYYM